MILEILLAAIAVFQANRPAPRPSETFWQKVLRIAGVTATPRTLRADGEAVEGDVWIARATADPQPRRLSRQGAFRSPVFRADGQSVLALSGGDLVEVSIRGGEAAKLLSIQSAHKLVGCSTDNPDQLLLLADDREGALRPALLHLASRRIEMLPFNPESPEDRRMLNHLRGWDRTYGDSTVYVKASTEEVLSGRKRVAEVLLVRGNSPPINISNCGSADCGQPSMSLDGTMVAFIRAAK